MGACNVSLRYYPQGRIPGSIGNISSSAGWPSWGRVNELIRGKRGVSPQTAWLLDQAFKTTSQFWLNLQSLHDLAKNRPEKTIEPLEIAM